MKWSIFLGLILIIGLYLFFGYRHAKSRLRKGLKPLAYHRVCSTMLMPVEPGETDQFHSGS